MDAFSETWTDPTTHQTRTRAFCPLKRMENQNEALENQLAVGVISTLTIAQTALAGCILRLDEITDGELGPAKTSDYTDRVY